MVFGAVACFFTVRIVITAKRVSHCAYRWQTSGLIGVKNVPGYSIII